MLSELLPSPEMHDDWRSFARALTSALNDLLAQSAGSSEITYVVSSTPINPGQLPQVPTGWAPVWLNTVDADLYLANPDYDPPTAPNLFFIDTGNIAEAAIEANKIATGAVTTAAILDGAVTSLELANAAVTNAALATNAVGTANIIDAAIVNAKIGTAAILTANIQDAAIISAKIADATIVNADIVDATILGAKIANGTIVTALIGDAQIVEAKIGALAVNEAKIANAAVTSAKIANLAVGTAHIQSAAITQALIANAQIVTAHIQDGQITNAKIGNTIQSASWNPTTKAGWSIDKNGLLQGQGIAIYDTGGNLVFGSGGTVSWQKITGFDPSEFGNRVSFSRFELGAYSWAAQNPHGLAGFVATPVFEEGLNGFHIEGNFTANGQYVDLRKMRSIKVTAGERLAVSAKIAMVAGLRFEFIIGYFDAAGAVIDYSVPLSVTAATSWANRQTAFATAPAGAIEAELYLRFYNKAGITGSQAARVAEPFIGGATVNQATVQPFGPGPNGFFEQLTSGNISSFLANAAIQTAQIADASITTAKIANAQITNALIADATIQSAKIVSLDASKINAASLSAITATVGLLRTATTGARLEIESNQIRVYDSSNVLRVRMGIW